MINNKIKEALEQNLSNCGNFTQKDINKKNKKSHKRIASMKDPEFTSKSLSTHKNKNAPSIDQLEEGFNAMKRHDKWKVDYTESSPSLRRHISKAEFNAIIDRLYTCWKVYKDKKEKQRYKYEEEQSEALTFKPEISKNSKSIIENLSRRKSSQDMKNKYLPIYKNKRLKEIENHKELKMNRIKQELEKKEKQKKLEEDEILRIVAEKTDKSKYNEEEFMENIENQLKIYKNKKKQEQEEFDSKYSDIKFKPKISKQSKI